MAVGPLRVSAGVIRLRPVRMRDGVHWSRIRLADRAHLEPWEPSADGEWTVRHTLPGRRCVRVCVRRLATAACCRT